MYTITFIHPDKAAAQVADEILGPHFEVLHIRQPEIAMATVRTLSPWAVVASLQQNRTHGLALAKDLRERLGGRACRFVVYGQPEGGEDAPLSIADIQAHWGVDRFVAGLGLLPIRDFLLELSQARMVPAPQLPKVERLTENVVVRPTVSQEAPASKPVLSASSSGEMTWGELLQAEASVDNVSSVLRKEIFGSSPAIPVRMQDIEPETDPGTPAFGSTAGYRLMTWGELMRSSVNKSSVKALLTRGLLNKSEKGE